MPSFTKQAFRTPFGVNEFLRSTQDIKTLSWTFAASTLPTSTIDGNPGQKVLQPGVVLSKITSGPDTGKVGPCQVGAGAGTVEQQTLTGTTVTAGTYTITVTTAAGVATTSALQWNATAATVQTAIRAAIDALGGTQYPGSNVTVTGGPVSTTPLVIAYGGNAGDVVPATVDQTALTGTIAVTTNVAGTAGANDGRQTLANIVGINYTFLPWQLMERDVEVSVIYEASVYQARCFEMNSAGVFIPLSDTQAAGMFGKKTLDIKFV